MVTCELSRVWCWLARRQHNRQRMQFTRGKEKSVKSRKTALGPFRKVCETKWKCTLFCVRSPPFPLRISPRSWGLDSRNQVGAGPCPSSDRRRLVAGRGNSGGHRPLLAGSCSLTAGIRLHPRRPGRRALRDAARHNRTALALGDESYATCQDSAPRDTVAGAPPADRTGACEGRPKSRPASGGPVGRGALVGGRQVWAGRAFANRSAIRLRTAIRGRARRGPGVAEPGPPNRHRGTEQCTCIRCLRRHASGRCATWATEWVRQRLGGRWGGQLPCQ